MGNRTFITYRVCKECNGGLGGTVDHALKQEWKVAQARYDRGVKGAQNNRFMSIKIPDTAVGKSGILDSDEQIGFFEQLGFPIAITKDEKVFCDKFGHDAILLGYIDDGKKYYTKCRLPDFNPQANLDVQGAVLKIAYESTHLYLGDSWLGHLIANEIREVLFAYVGSDKNTAQKKVKNTNRLIRSYDCEKFYRYIGRSRNEFVKKAEASKCCLNGLWLCPLIERASRMSGLGIVFDIEGLPFGYVVVGNRKHGIDQITQLYP